MAILSKGTTFATGNQVTAANLNALVDSATFASGAVDNTSTALDSSSPQKIIVKDSGITTSKLADSSSKTTGVTFAKMQHISTAKVLGRSTAGEGDVEEAFDFKDEDDLGGGSSSATALASQQSIKAYVDSTGIVQTALASTTTEVTTTAVIPADDTIPQIGEGAATGLSVSMTPTSTSNTIRATIQGRFRSNTATGIVVVALFEDNTCVGVSEYRQPGSGLGAPNSTYYFNSASTSAHTYTVRIGSGTSAPSIIMDIDPTYGGVNKATLFLEEISV